MLLYPIPSHVADSLPLFNSNLTRTADFLAAALQKLDFIIMSQGAGAGLPLVAFRLNPENKHPFDEFAIARRTSPLMHLSSWPYPHVY